MSGPVLFQMATMQELKNIRKNISTDTLLPLLEVSIEIDEIEASVFDVMIARFPHVATDIFKELDDKTLTNCRRVNRLWYDHLDDQKFYFIRMIQRYRKNMKNSYQQWKKVFKNTPVEYVKELSISIKQYLNDDILRSTLQWSPMQLVADQGNFELCKYIFEKTKNTKPKRKYRCTALHMAANKGLSEICEFLIDNSEDKNPFDDNGKTPLHYAASRGFTNVCKLIIENVENKNPAGPNGCTPLHLAAKEGHLEIVRLIVETGVDKNTLFHGKTPLQSLNKFRSYTLYRLLSKDKFQLCDIICRDLVLCFVGCFFLFIFVFMTMMILLMKYYNMPRCEMRDLECTSILQVCGSVSLLIALFLTILIRVRTAYGKGFPGNVWSPNP